MTVNLSLLVVGVTGMSLGLAVGFLMHRYGEAINARKELENDWN